MKLWKNPAFWLAGAAVATTVVVAVAASGQEIDPLPWDDNLVADAFCSVDFATLTGGYREVATGVAMALFPVGFEARSGAEIRLEWPPPLNASAEQRRVWRLILAVAVELEQGDRRCRT